MILDFFIASFNKSTFTKHDNDDDGDDDDDKAVQNFFDPGIFLCLSFQSWVFTGWT